MKGIMIIVAAGTFWAMTTHAGVGIIGAAVFAAACYYLFRTKKQ